jgi:4-hydroxybenzoyl-CoA thioesterase
MTIFAAAVAPRTSDDSSDRVTLRFLVAPSDMDASGESVQAGRVLEWIDRAGYACAVGWSAAYCVTAYVGDVHFSRPIAAGSIVQAHARIIHTGRTSMQVFVSIETSDARDRTFVSATHCILVFVAVDETGKPREVPRWEPWDDGERTLQVRAAARIEPRKRIRDAMLAATYTDAGTTPRTVFRFLASPGDTNWGGNTHGGTVMRWIDETAYACAASWSSTAAAAVYSGGIHFYRPIPIGNLVEVDARLIHTGDHSMHISVRVRTGSPTAPRALELATQCLTVFVERAGDGRAAEIAPLSLVSDEDRRLDAHAIELIALREDMAVIPHGLARFG